MILVFSVLESARGAYAAVGICISIEKRPPVRLFMRESLVDTALLWYTRGNAMAGEGGGPDRLIRLGFRGQFSHDHIVVCASSAALDWYCIFFTTFPHDAQMVGVKSTGQELSIPFALAVECIVNTVCSAEWRRGRSPTQGVESDPS